MIYTTISNAYQFRDAVQQAGRGKQFSYDALGLLFDFLEDMGEDYELDVIALCCEFYEDTPEAIADNYNIELGPDADVFDQVVEYLENETSVCGYDMDQNIIVYAAF